MWEKAMHQYNLGHPDILKRIESGWKSTTFGGNGYRHWYLIALFGKSPWNFENKVAKHPGLDFTRH
jgi:hypothetical protein